MGLLVMAWSTSSLLSILGGLSSKTLLVKEIAAHPERGPGLLGAAMVVRTGGSGPKLPRKTRSRISASATSPAKRWWCSGWRP